MKCRNHLVREVAAKEQELKVIWPLGAYLERALHDPAIWHVWGSSYEPGEGEIGITFNAGHELEAAANVLGEIRSWFGIDTPTEQRFCSADGSLTWITMGYWDGVKVSFRLSVVKPGGCKITREEKTVSRPHTTHTYTMDCSGED